LGGADHVACAGGQDVLSAGEIGFAFRAGKSAFRISRVMLDGTRVAAATPEGDGSADNLLDFLSRSTAY
jgi:hypothetical protein